MPRLRLSHLFILLFAFILSPAEVVSYDRSDGLSSPIVGGGVQGDNGLMWFATWNGLHCFDGYDFYRVSIEPGESSSINTNLIRTISKAPSGNIICRTDNGFYEFDLRTMSFRDLPASATDSLSSLLCRVWHGTTIRQGITDILWTGSTQGIRKQLEPHHPARLLSGSSRLSPRSVMIDRKGNLWIGSRNNPQITVFNDLIAIDSLELDFTPYCIYESSAGLVFMGGKPGGLVRSDGKRISDDIVYDIVEDKNGRLWIATWGDGIKCISGYDGDNPVVKSLGVGRKVRKLLVTREGNLVAATSEGLIAIRPENMMVRNVHRIPGDASSLASDATMSLTQDSQGNIFVATESSGVSRVAEKSLFSDTPEFIHYTVRNSALDHDEICGIALENDTTLIITGPDRVTILNPHTGRSIGYGMPFWGEDITFAEGTPVRTSDGTWFFATSRGVLKASAHSLFTRGYIPPIVITAVSLNGGAERLMLLPDGRLNLDSESRNVTLRFAAIDYVDNSCILYRYSVDGSPWSAYNTDRTRTLFNLSAGDHKVLIQSTDRFGRRVDNTLTLTISVAPRWHETWWARTLFILSAIAALACGIWLIIYVRQVKRQRSELLSKYMALLETSTYHSVPTFDEEPVVESVEDELFLRRVRAYIESNLSNPDANIDAMADASAVSRSTLNRKLRNLMGISAARLLFEARMNRAAVLLSDGLRSITEVATACGYTDPYYFARVYRKHTGKNPKE